MQLLGNRPWKRPILLVEPGGTWRQTDDDSAGAWLDGSLHADDPRIGQ